MNFKTLKDFDLKDRRVLLRLDLNVPKQDGNVTDTTRIDRVKPTIDYLREQGAKIIIISHFGRPKGERDSALSLAFLVSVLQKQWDVDVGFAQDCIGSAATGAVKNMAEGDILLLENLRFHAGEGENDPQFIKSLAALGDLYVNDAFSVSHRADASTEGLAHVMPAAAGFLMEQELVALDQALGNPKTPVAALVGGSKISTKLGVLNNLIERVDVLILGGGMANTFLHAKGASIGASLCEHDMKDEALAILAKAEKENCAIILPEDSVCVTKIQPGAASEIHASNTVPDNMMAIDIGPKTIEAIEAKLAECKTILWNGPMGVFEIKPFDAGTNAIATWVAEQTKAGKIISVAGGGDTVSALENAGAANRFTYLSTAGGAFLEWMEGKILPGVAALMNYKKAS